MLGRYKKKVSLYVGGRNKAQFVLQLPSLIKAIPQKEVAIDVISFSGSKYFYDQIFSILSFHYNVGIPVCWKVFNDGTYLIEEKEVLRSIPGVQVVDLDMEDVDSRLISACAKFPTLKKMIIYQKINPERTTIFTDSDIMFYKSAGNTITKLFSGNWFITDESNRYFDTDFLAMNPDINDPLNLGLLIINKPLNWQIPLDYLFNKIDADLIDYWTDQTAMQILANVSPDFRPLDKNLFVTNGSDSFSVGHHFNYNKIAVRHFVGPIRHKMWQYSWKKVLR